MISAALYPIHWSQSLFGAVESILAGSNSFRTRRILFKTMEADSGARKCSVTLEGEEKRQGALDSAPPGVRLLRGKTASQDQEAEGSEGLTVSGRGAFGCGVRPRYGCRPNSISFSLSLP